MRRLIRFELLLLAPCVVCVGLSFWVVEGYPGWVEAARRTPAPEGRRYLDTCDGRPTRVVGDLEAGCLADYPGEFARGVLSGASVAFFLLANLAQLLLRRGRARGAAPGPM